MTTSFKTKLIVQPLEFKHLSMLEKGLQDGLLSYFQKLIIINWIALLEETIKIPTLSRKEKCYVLIEDNTFISYLITKPCNLRQTCWTISYPKFIKEPKLHSRCNIYQELLKTALEDSNISPKSWLTSIPIWDNQNLSISRGLGFQPLKVIKYWISPKSNNFNSIDKTKYKSQDQFTWQKLNRSNSKFLCHLEQSRESANLRSIFDRHWDDILEQRNKYTGALISHKNNSKSVIAGLINSICPQDKTSLELIRGILWDERISLHIPRVLNKMKNIKNLCIETTSEDKKLNNLLKDIGWKECDERILLGKNVLRRNKIKAKNTVETSLDELLTVLNPPAEMPTP